MKARKTFEEAYGWVIAIFAMIGFMMTVPRAIGFCLEWMLQVLKSVTK